MRFAVWVLILLIVPGSANAETIRIARQFGLSYLPLILMQDRGLLEAEGKVRGLDLHPEWLTFTGGPPINDALISGNIDLAAGGVGPMLTIWSRTRNSLRVRGLAALGDMPMWLVTNRAGIASLKDFTPGDRIALPGVKVSIQAVVLQMAAEATWGPGQAFRLDPLTVSMGHPDAETALLGGHSEVTAHFSSAPFMYEEAADPHIHRVLDSNAVLGGPHSFNLVWATTRWFDAHKPEAAAFSAALGDAMAIINKDPSGAAATWVRVEHTRLGVADAAEMIRRPENTWTTTPHRTMQFARFMSATGAIGPTPTAWTDLFFDIAAGLDGS